MSFIAKSTLRIYSGLSFAVCIVFGAVMTIEVFNVWTVWLKVILKISKNI
jgi:hypothetical protein